MLLQTAFDLKPVWVPPGTSKKILFIGSILQGIAPGDLVIGTGAFRERPHSLPDSAVIVGLRGPRTAEVLEFRSAVPFGDPGLLAASLLGISKQQSNGRIAFVPHYVDLDNARTMWRKSKVLQESCDIVEIGQEPRLFLETLSQFDACVSSALHGVVGAESLGIPTIAITLRDVGDGHDFKFHDYFEGTGRRFSGLVGVEDGIAQLESRRVFDYMPDLGPLHEMMHRAAEAMGAQYRLAL